jgi:hypothetical protein
MNSIPKGKFIASLAGMFLVGILTGGLAASAFRKEASGHVLRNEGSGRPFGKDHEGGQRPPPASFPESMMGMLDRNLKLTAVQSNTIVPKVEQLGRDIDLIRANGFKETDKQFKDFREWLLPHLTEEQKAAHAKMEEGRQKFMKDGGGRGKGGRPSGGFGGSGGPRRDRGPGEQRPQKEK